jgi:uncharacterized low-complexity protein
LHESLQVVDMQADTLLWDRSLLDRSDRGHVDLPRLQDGNVALEVFASVTKSPKGQNYDSNSADSDDTTLLTFAQLQPRGRGPPCGSGRCTTRRSWARRSRTPTGHCGSAARPPTSSGS